MSKNIKYNQLNQEERVIIAHLWRNKKSINYIAQELKRSWDTIRNELERNGKADKYSGKIIYSARKAEKKYVKRRKESKEKYRIIESNYKVEEKIIELIVKEQYSPEQISNRFNTVSHQTIYNWLYRMEDIKLKKKIVSNLRRRGKTYRKTSKLYTYQSITAPKTMINERLDIINNRERLGDFEGDTVLLNGLERFYTLTDRRSGYEFILHIPNGKAETIHRATLELSKRKEWKKVKSITYDNGVEFSYHDLISNDLSIPIYFAFPYHSWERGTNENTNGLIRQYYPKGKIHDKISSSDIKLLEKKLNNRPRKRLNYLTPYEVFVLGLDPEKNSRVQDLI